MSSQVSWQRTLFNQKQDGKIFLTVMGGGRGGPRPRASRAMALVVAHKFNSGSRKKPIKEKTRVDQDDYGREVAQAQPPILARTRPRRRTCVV
jgi:hypothetical protein